MFMRCVARRCSATPHVECIVILELESGDDRVTVEISGDTGNRKIRIGGTEIECDWVRIDAGHYSLIIDGRVLDALVNVDSEGCVVASNQGAFSFRVLDPRRSAFRHRPEGPAGVQRIAAEMPGRIIRVLVEKGEEVVHDQSLLVIEAMKMQTEIRAPKNGTVKELAASAGANVSAGDFLMSIES